MKNNRHPDQLSLFEQQKREQPHLSDPDAVRAICERLLDESDARPPVNVELLASMRGIVRIEERTQTYSGMLVHEKRGMVAHVRLGDSHRRRRFTVLHEAGHTLLPGYAETRQFRCKGPRTWEEQLCDLAASELLLPRRFFAGDLAETGFGIASAENLATYYQASIEATAIRSVDLWAQDAMLMVLKIAHKPSERGREDEMPAKLRLAWSYCKGQWPFIRQHKSVLESSPLGRAQTGEIIEEIGEIGDLAADDAGRLGISAKRYGNDGHVIALLTKEPLHHLQVRRT